MLGGIVFFVINVCLYVCAVRLTRRLAGPMWLSSRLYRVVSTGVIACSLIVLSVLALGIPGHLSSRNLLILWVTAAGLVGLITLRRGAVRIPLQGSAVVTHERPGWPRTVLVALLLCGALFYVHSFYRQALNPPGNWDDLTYHLYFPATWIQTGTIDNPITAFGDIAPSYSPMNTEMLNYWVMHAWRSDVVARVLQHLFLVVCGGLIGLISRKAGSSSEAATLSGLLFILIPYYLTQGYGIRVDQTISNDITALALYLAAVYAGMFTGLLTSGGPAVIAGAALGLFVGSKYISLVLAVPLAIWMVFRIISGPRPRWFRVLILIGAAVVTGGFSYGRNWILTGNPIYPTQVTIGDWSVFTGPYTAESLHSSVYSMQFAWRTLFEGTAGYSSVLVMAICAIYLVVIGISLFDRWIGKRRVLPVCLLVLPVLNALIFHTAIPFKNARFLMFAAAPVLIVAARCWDAWRVPGWVVAIGLIAVDSLRGNLEAASFYPRYWKASIITVAVAGTLLVLYRRIVRRSPHPLIDRVGAIAGRSGLAIGVALMAFVWIPVGVMRDRQRPAEGYFGELLYKAKYPAWEFLLAQSDSVAEPLRIASAGLNCGYAFMGRGYKDQSLYVPVNDTGTMPHEFGDGNYREPMDRNVWIDNLSEERIDYLICQPVGTNIPEDRWAARMPDRFRKVFDDQCSRVYRFIDPFPTRENETAPDRIGHPDTMVLMTPEPGPGGDFIAVVVWSIDTDRPMEFEYSIDTTVLSKARYPSPAFSPRCIHRIHAPVPESLTPGNHAFTVRIRSESDDRVESIRLAGVRSIDRKTVVLLPAPAHLSPQDQTRLDPHSRFAWDSVPGAIGYLLGVTLPDGTRVDRFLHETDLDSYWEEEAYRRLPAGRYTWHVAAVDAHGYTGKPSTDIVFRVDSSR